ncbi:MULTISPECIES: GAP family protein [unclassified Cyanobium]|uniref:GAP family protein n=1 Tax=unclassified Cyanobium TaxID=2627006 RepID=UPI0020CEE7F4|nr:MULTISPECIES: GAP family protein [unclassified Cyanobium]MCP9834794.1 GAP family protein [Cyanobium sp. La Preciosa 7G6]MCP9937582.1 GAP family protein [Cyanobium sp. Aljojuca 7A6]
MTALPFDVVPLALGAAVSPLLLVGQMRLLTAPGSGVKQSWAYAAGNALVVGGWAVVGLGSGGSLPVRPAAGADPVSAGIHLVLAAVLLAIGVHSLHRDAGTGSPAPDGHTLARSFAMGAVLMAGNLTSLVLYLPALQDLARSGLAAVPLAGLVLLVSLVTLAPSLLPPVVLVLTGAWGRAHLERLCRWTLVHQGQINAGLCLGFAAYLGRSGVARL